MDEDGKALDDCLEVPFHNADEALVSIARIVHGDAWRTAGVLGNPALCETCAECTAQTERQAEEPQAVDPDSPGTWDEAGRRSGLLAFNEGGEEGVGLDLEVFLKTLADLDEEGSEDCREQASLGGRSDPIGRDRKGVSDSRR